MDCIFCKIVAGQIPAEKVYEDDQFVAILDISPVNSGHTLVLPKVHTANFSETDDETLAAMLLTLKKISRAIVTATAAEGFNVATNNGAAAGQTVEHLHFHIIPRYFKDSFATWPQGNYNDDQAAAVGQRIRDSFR